MTVKMLSIIIPYKNDEELIKEVVDNYCYGLDTSLFEIIVVNGGSCYPSGKFKPLELGFFSQQNVRVINVPISRGVGYSLDRGVEQAIGDIIIISGADVFPHRVKWFKDVIRSDHNNVR